MATTAIVQVQVDADLKLQAEKILAEEGLTVSDILRAALICTVRDHGAPRDLFASNPETIEALREADQGNLPGFKDLRSLKAYLNADD